MRYINLQLEDSFYSEFINYINNNKNIIQIIDDDEFTADDELHYKIAMNELKNGDTISIDELELEIVNV